jgi:peptidoglycan/LPS O-acetylase OafA/YrhL
MVTSNNYYVPSLTGLRGIAAWWVVFYHFSEPLSIAPHWVITFVSYGYLAVDLFFILSGYVIYLTTRLQLAKIGWGGAVKFWIVRVIRIFPLHLFVMTLFLLNPLALHFFSDSGVAGDRYSWGYFFASLFLVQNWGFFPDLKWNIPSWSISTEFAAYLISPLLIWFGVSKIDRRRDVLVFAIVGASALLGIIFHFDERESIGQGITSLGLIRCILEFWIGLCVGALACADRECLIARNSNINSILILCILLIFIFLSLSSLDNYWFVPILFSLLVYFIGMNQGIFSRLLGSRFIHYLGLISYSTYLLHFFIKDWVKFLSPSIGVAQFLIYIVACFIGSILSFHAVEKPSRDWLRKRYIG